MSNQERLTLLTVGLSRPVEETDSVVTTSVADGRQTIAAMRLLRFDLLLAGMHVTDMSTWALMQRIRTGWPGQHWAFVGQGAAEEVRARSLGALCVFGEVPEQDELDMLAEALRKQPVKARLVHELAAVPASKAS